VEADALSLAPDFSLLARNSRWNSWMGGRRAPAVVDPDEQLATLFKDDGPDAGLVAEEGSLYSCSRI